MARMKFLCDADRCIDCNACATACKNENEVPWGINRRRRHMATARGEPARWRRIGVQNQVPRRR
jgi:Fe-S-cluster-containing dehydrogenase component